MATDVRKLAQDAAYVTVGAGVLAFQRAQVARREVRSRLESGLSDTANLVNTVVAAVNGALPEPIAKLSAKLVAGKLPFGTKSGS